jgi:Lsr2 protein
VRFGFGGAEYEIDLNKKNAAAFRKKISPFLGHVRKAGRVAAWPYRTQAHRG